MIICLRCASWAALHYLSAGSSHIHCPSRLPLLAMAGGDHCPGAGHRGL
ncbi:MAG: hypothetical protein ACOX84_07340 [Methanothrix sp.]